MIIYTEGDIVNKNYLVKIVTEAGVTEIETKELSYINSLIRSIEFDNSPTLNVKVYEERI